MSSQSTRAAAFAGSFYPDAPDLLHSSIAAMLALPESVAFHPKALIVPHAGYIYSGPIAASAYAGLQKSAVATRLVVLFGPAHRVWVGGMAATSADWFETPLGKVPVDQGAIAAVSHLPQIEINDAAHAQEHSLEVQLPFLQTVLDNFAIAPFVVGGASTEQVVQVMEMLWGGPETLIVVSSDLSHYLPYAEAQRIDHATADSILERHSITHHEQACGSTPINGLLEVARRKGLVPSLLDLRNSGDTAGDHARVVGYGAFAFAESHHV